MKQIEVINQETIIDVTAETSNVEILVRDYDSELAERFALEAQEAASDAEESADIATAQASIATAQAGIATTQAGIATTQAGNALTSANNAAASAQEAQDIVDSIITADLTEATSSVLTITGGTDAVLGTGTTIQVKQAGSSQSGFLSSTDWTTFNSKQNTITNPVTGTGASGQVAFWNGTSSQTGDNGLFWDNTNKRLGIGTNTPSSYSYLTSAITAAIGNTSANGQLSILSSTTGAGAIAFADGTSGGERFAGEIRYDHAANEMYFRTNNNINGFIASNGRWLIGSVVTPSNTLDVNGTARIRNGAFIASDSGNVVIGSTTDSGFRLDVNGTARVQGVTTITRGAGETALTASFGGANSSIVLQSHSTSDFSRIQIGTAFALSREGGGVSNINSTASALRLTSNITEFSGTNVLIRIIGANTSFSAWNSAASTITFGNGFNTYEFIQQTRARHLVWHQTDTSTNPTIFASALFSLSSTTRGFLPPRMTTTQKNAIDSPETGLVVYDTTLNKLSVRGALTWETVTSV